LSASGGLLPSRDGALGDCYPQKPGIRRRLGEGGKVDPFLPFETAL
jgi:hypothetical protein